MVENIDKISPNITVISSNTESNTMQSVFVIAEFYDENGVISKQYSYDNENWENYTIPITAKEITTT